MILGQACYVSPPNPASGRRLIPPSGSSSKRCCAHVRQIIIVVEDEAHRTQKDHRVIKWASGDCLARRMDDAISSDQSTEW